MKKQKFVKKLTKALSICLCCILCIGVLSCTALTVFGADEPSDGGGSARITDLTGYTVLVFPGWQSPPNLGDFSLYGDYVILYGVPIHNQFINFRIGITARGLGQADVIGFEGLDVSTDYGFQLDIYGGNDVSNLLLIDWLYDNNATFINNNEPEPEPEPEPVIGWAINEPINFFSTPIVETTPPTVVDYQTIYYYSDWEKPYAILRDVISQDGESFLPVVFYYDTYYEALYYGMDYIEREILTEPVFMDGFEKGRLQGKTEGQSSAIGSNLIGSGFTAITEALNQIIVYQSSTGTVVTLWVIISGAVGIALFIWILKLFAGG